MKNRIGISLAYVVTGILTALIPTVIFPVCDSSEKKMACFYTGQAEIGLGIVIAILGLITVAIKSEDIRIGISISQIANALLVILFPIKLTGLCGMDMMPCRMGTEPALIVAAIILIVISAINILYLNGKDK